MICLDVCETVSRLEGGCNFGLGREIHAPGCECEDCQWWTTGEVVVNKVGLADGQYMDGMRGRWR